MAALSFQVAKQQFFQALGSHGYGAWIGKPLEEKGFDAKEGAGYEGQAAGQAGENVAVGNQGYGNNNNNSYGGAAAEYSHSQEWYGTAQTQAM